MDGKNRKVIARNNLKWPNGLTLDYPNRFVFPFHSLLLPINSFTQYPVSIFY